MVSGASSSLAEHSADGREECILFTTLQARPVEHPFESQKLQITTKGQSLLAANI